MSVATGSRGPDLLEAVVAGTRRVIVTRRAAESDAALEMRAMQRTPDGAGFRACLGRPHRVNVIAECKRRSPSRGVLRHAYDPARIALAYESAGAVALSVLTEPMFFDGSVAHLQQVRQAVRLPLLRKDFVVDEYQIVEARAAGADAILLIVAALPDRDLQRLLHSARALSLAALVEIHDDAELDRALAAGADIIGVNNRNLRTLAVDLEASERIARQLPRDVMAVAESGLRTREDLQRLRGLGYHAFLIGERFMTAADPGAALRSLLHGDDAH